MPRTLPRIALSIALASACGDVDPGQTCRQAHLDLDADGFGDPTTRACRLDGVEDGSDCDDADPAVHPGAVEVCNDGVDDDCDPLTDEHALEGELRYDDADDDGYGAGDPVLRCAEAPLTATVGGDCDDGDSAVHPDAPEVCNGGVDDDCDPLTDEEVVAAPTWHLDGDSDGFGAPQVRVRACEGPPGTVLDGTDCDDDEDAVNPGATDVCNGGVDDDCDPLTDEDTVSGALWYRDVDADGHGDPLVVTQSCDSPAGWQTSSDDCDDLAWEVHPGVCETCNGGVDDDCDPLTDEDVVAAPAWYVDADADGWGDALWGTSCVQPADTAPLSGDCDDADADVHPSAAERCNGVDDDCDAATLEADLAWYADEDGDGFGDPDFPVGTGCEVVPGAAMNAGDCDDALPNVHAGAPEQCDAVDDDCDARTAVDPCAPVACVWIPTAGRYDPLTGAKVDDHPSCSFDTIGPDGDLYLGISCAPGRVDRYDGETCELLGTFATLQADPWHIFDDTGGGPSCLLYVGEPAFTLDGVAMVAPWVGPYDGTAGLEWFDATSGAALGTADLDTGFDYNFNATRLAADGRMYLVVTRDKVVEVDLATYAVAEVAPDAIEPLSAEIGPDDALYVLEEAGAIRRYDRATGAWLGDLVETGVGGVVTAGDLVYDPRTDVWSVLDVTANALVRFDGRGVHLGTTPVDEELYATHPAALGSCPPWVGLALSAPDELARGQTVSLEVFDAPPLALVWIVYGAPGDGACPPELGGACLGVAHEEIAVVAQADELGRATADWVVPLDTNLAELALQAVVYDLESPRISAVELTVVTNACSP